MFSSLACVASEKVTRLSRFFIETPKEVLHFPFVTSEETSDNFHKYFIFTPKEALETGLFFIHFCTFSTLQHTDFIPFLMFRDRWFYSFFRAQRSNKKTIKTSKNLYKNDPFLPIIFTLKKTKNQQVLPSDSPLIFPLIFLLFYPFWDVLKRLYFHPLVYL